MIVRDLVQAHGYIADAVARSKRITVKFMGGNWIITASDQPRTSKLV